jgi:methylmalonyl-CoA mutase N-terminal domain/subunit
VHTNAFDEALALPTERSATIARRTQQILATEAGGTAAADPLGGSYYSEALTDELAGEARSLEAVDRAARGRDNLLPPILAAVRAHVTLGEICDTLRRVFGTHQPSVVF